MSHKPGRDKRASDKREAMRLERAAYGAMNSNPPTIGSIYAAQIYHERKRLEAFVTRVTKLHWIVNTWGKLSTMAYLSSEIDTGAPVSFIGRNANGLYAIVPSAGGTSSGETKLEYLP